MKKCKVRSCEHGHVARGYCNRHYLQIKTHGKIRGHPKRSKFDPNEFIVDGNICKVKLFDQAGYFRAEALVDSADLSLVEGEKWYVSTLGYAVARSGALSMAHVILGQKARPDSLIDHKNRTKLDNRRQNLRPCSKSQNAHNANKRKDNVSGYRGVSWDRQRQKWVAKIAIKGKQIHLGRFQDKHEAARVFNAAAKKYHGRFARLNTGKE